MSWYKIKEHTPDEGIPVVISFEDFTTDIGYYFNRDFYNLKIDPRLGILRKECVTKPVIYWTEYAPNCFYRTKGEF